MNRILVFYPIVCDLEQLVLELCVFLDVPTDFFGI